MNKRIILIVCDSMGVGEMPDAPQFKDAGAHTFNHIVDGCPNFAAPNLGRLGLGEIETVNLPGDHTPVGAYGRCKEISCGKDTTTGHWEMMGTVTDKDWPTYPNGFPKEVMDEFEKQIGRGSLGNYPASGTDILTKLGEEHMKTGSPIVYTSADSVFQIAAHEDIIPIQELYRICEIARKILDGEHRVARVIARPFIGEPGNFARTPRRHDYSVLPPHTILNTLVDSGIPVHAVGKIHDIFAGQGISSNVGTVSNMDGVDKTLEAMKNIKSGLIFVNLVDFDMLFGHRRDVLGYGKAIMEFDTRLPEIEAAMTENDILLLTADHGCDPAFVAHTDHTREYIPLLLHGQKVRTGALGTQEGFTNIARFVLSYLLPENKELATIPGSLTADKILS